MLLVDENVRVFKGFVACARRRCFVLSWAREEMREEEERDRASIMSVTPSNNGFLCERELA